MCISHFSFSCPTFPLNSSSQFGFSLKVSPKQSNRPNRLIRSGHKKEMHSNESHCLPGIQTTGRPSTQRDRKTCSQGYEVRIEIHAISVMKHGWWAQSITAPPGFGLLMHIVSGRKPLKPILGAELPGEIEAVSRDVT